MKIITTSRGHKIMVDDEDYPSMSRIAWHLCGPIIAYATTNARHPDGRHTTIKMHRLIMNARPGQCVDHIDGNPLNNQRSNLRFLTAAENGRAKCVKSRTRKCTSKYRGVSWHPQNRKWRARVFFNYRQHCAGCYGTEIEAAIAYNKRALELGFLPECLNNVEAA